MSEDRFNAGETLKQCHLFLPLTSEELVVLYHYLKCNIEWHPVIRELASNRGVVPWSLIEGVRKRLKLPQPLMISTLLTIARAFLCVPGMELDMEQPDQGQEAPSLEEKGGIGAETDAGDVRKGRRRSQLTSKVRSLVESNRRGDDSDYVTMRRLVTDNPTPDGFREFANPVLEKTGMALSLEDSELFLKRFSPRVKRGNGKVGSGAGKSPKQPGEISEVTQRKLDCLVRQTGGGDESLDEGIRQLLTDHHGPKAFGSWAKPILEAAGLKGFSVKEYHAIRRRNLSEESAQTKPTHSGRSNPSSKSGGAAQLDQGVRVKLEAMARQSGWESSTIKAMVQQVFRRSNGQATEFMANLNQVATAAGTPTFSAEEADAAIQFAGV